MDNTYKKISNYLEYKLLYKKILKALPFKFDNHHWKEHKCYSLGNGYVAINTPHLTYFLDGRILFNHGKSGEYYIFGEHQKQLIIESEWDIV